jgi:hypothetical protein
MTKTTKTKTRRQPTEEQKQAAEERRSRLRELAKKVSAMSEEERNALLARIGRIPTAAATFLSPYNSCFVVSQLPVASQVGGFKQWQAAGRQVKKGEKALAIWIPVKGAENTDPTAEDIEAKSDRQRFILGNVFDISQTDEIGQ